ncbi:cobyrinate a,c-diamide synthase [Dactylosporangium sp. NPDC049140]|uniref:cobyrinate a,c-diamide synthase n=1 Tax=Dactylosporangium sp. NPDC049140 TaxID=3155647 RepID=UPI0033D83E51
MSTIPRLVISAPSSGHGKTAVSVGLLAALSARGYRAAGFKIGPDHVDAAYLGLAAGRPGRNLDPRMVSAKRMGPLFAHGAASLDIAVVEGTMGLFDGLAGRTDSESTAQISGLLRAPVILVVDVGAMGQSVAALVHGFRAYDELLWLGGVILNRVASTRHEQLLREALDDIGVPVLGALRRHALTDAGESGAPLPSRHHGVAPVVHHNLDAVRAVRRLGEVIAGAVDIDRTMALARSAPRLTSDPWSAEAEIAAAAESQSPVAATRIGRRPIVGVAFAYPETAELLTAAGAEVVPFDPLRDEVLPAGVDGLVIGAALPESYAEELTFNGRLRSAVAAHAAAGKPIAAEGTGLVWLCRDFNGRPMCGVVDASARETDLVVLGYREATARSSSVLLPVGAQVIGHKMHRTSITPRAGLQAAWTWAGGPAEGFVQRGVHASYLGLHWAGTPAIASRFVAAAGATAAPAPGQWSTPSASPYGRPSVPVMNFPTAPVLPAAPITGIPASASVTAPPAAALASSPAGALASSPAGALTSSPAGALTASPAGALVASPAAAPVTGPPAAPVAGSSAAASVTAPPAAASVLSSAAGPLAGASAAGFSPGGSGAGPAPVALHGISSEGEPLPPGALSYAADYTTPDAPAPKLPAAIPGSILASPGGAGTIAASVPASAGTHPAVGATYRSSAPASAPTSPGASSPFGPALGPAMPVPWSSATGSAPAGGAASSSVSAPAPSLVSAPGSVLSVSGPAAASSVSAPAAGPSSVSAPPAGVPSVSGPPAGVPSVSGPPAGASSGFSSAAGSLPGATAPVSGAAASVSGAPAVASPTAEPVSGANADSGDVSGNSGDGDGSEATTVLAVPGATDEASVGVPSGPNEPAGASGLPSSGVVPVQSSARPVSSPAQSASSAAAPVSSPARPVSSPAHSVSSPAAPVSSAAGPVSSPAGSVSLAGGSVTGPITAYGPGAGARGASAAGVQPVSSPVAGPVSGAAGGAGLVAGGAATSAAMPVSSAPMPVFADPMPQASAPVSAAPGGVTSMPAGESEAVQSGEAGSYPSQERPGVEIAEQAPVSAPPVSGPPAGGRSVGTSSIPAAPVSGPVSAPPGSVVSGSVPSSPVSGTASDPSAAAISAPPLSGVAGQGAPGASNVGVIGAGGRGAGHVAPGVPGAVAGPGASGAVAAPGAGAAPGVSGASGLGAPRADGDTDGDGGGGKPPAGGSSEAA